MNPPIHPFPIRPEWIELLVGLLLGACLWYAVRKGRVDLRRIARRRALWIVTFSLLGPCLRLALIPLVPIPVPVIHDDFVNLLAADTLMQGRLANPPHALPEFFETIYVFQRPTYSAIYPLGTAVFLAAGWMVTGHPWFGMWFAMVLCCGAIAWMLYRCVPPLAAWTGGLLFSLIFGISSYWMNSYYGGAVPALGGALVFGALPAVASRPTYKNIAILSLGWTCIWFTRPYESVMVGLIVGVAILRALWRMRRQPVVRKLAAGALFLGAVVALDFAGFCDHNFRVTGNPLVHPYLLSQKVYGVPSALFWQKEIPEPPGLNPRQERVYVWVRSLAHRGQWRWPDLKKIWALYVGYPLSLPLAIAIFAANRKARPMRFFLIICLAWSLLFPETQPHYVAAATGLFLAMASVGLLRLSYRWPALAVGLFLASALACLRVLYGWYLFAGPPPVPPRAAIARRLESTPGSHLVFVRYGPQHSIHDEWVYNRADIDHAKIVWANDLGAERDAQLVRYFGNRQVWLVEPDERARLSLLSLSPAEYTR